MRRNHDWTEVIMGDRSSLATDLEAVLEGALTEEDFRLRYQSGPTSTLVDAIW
jgi:hypothetical protein